MLADVSSIEGMMWDDANGDGIQNSGEEFIDSGSAYLYDDSGNLINSVPDRKNGVGSHFKNETRPRSPLEHHSCIRCPWNLPMQM